MKKRENLTSGLNLFENKIKKPSAGLFSDRGLRFIFHFPLDVETVDIIDFIDPEEEKSVK